jgi:hypothetical protein
MRDLVEHPSTGLTIDFSRADFGGPEQTAVIDEWRARRAAGRSGRLSDPGEFVCHLHRDHEHRFMYLRMDEDTERVGAAHWPGSGLEAHTIVHTPSPEHDYQAEYLGNAAQAVGHQVAMEEYLPTGVKPDLLISGPRAIMSAEVQRSRIGVPTAKRRTTQALLAGATPTWFTDTRANPKWLGHVPGVRFNPDTSWDTVPHPRTVSVAGVRHILERNCRKWPGSPCPRHSRGCTAWHPDHTPQRGVFADDLAELVPVGELVPMEFKTFGGRKLVLVVFADSKARYEAMVGHSADLTLNSTARRRMPAGQEGLIACASPTAGALIARARQEAANPTPGLALTPAQQQTASELPWYRHWLLEHGYSEDDLIPFAIA